MTKASVIVDKDFVLSDLDRRIFGQFAEHMGRCIYGGLYEPGHPTADEHGFRQDVMELVKELGVTIVRYPGGNMLSGYNWEDGVGPKDQRPRRLELSRFVTETNQMGTDDFIDWCRKTGIEPMLATNVASRDLNGAWGHVEYCNIPGGTTMSDKRRANGYEEPHNVKFWCIGNEPDGFWQIAQKSAKEYGRIVAEAAKIIKWIDHDIEVAASASSNRNMPHYGDWERTILEDAFEYIDYLAPHTYFKNDPDTMEFFANIELMDTYIKETVAMCDAVAGQRRSSKRIMLSFDEWNIAARWKPEDKKAKPGEWPEVMPIIEDVYTVEDALLIGGTMQTLINNGDRVKVACFAQLVNVIAPIMTEDGGPAWRQTIFWPLALASKYGHGKIMKQVVSSEKTSTKAWAEMPYLVSTVLHDDATGQTVIFALNRNLEEPMDLSVALKGLGAERRITATHEIANADLKATNTKDNPDNIRPGTIALVRIDGETVNASLKPASWNVIVIN
ncbi:MAG TPA: alpha-L-arabinofuranosidase C-terminal domain-containing protein [Devosia sp.]|nr:alpha-L-arabinofuranosidase C-terminal domain-containing protein [Devosia sp.]